MNRLVALEVLALEAQLTERGPGELWLRNQPARRKVASESSHAARGEGEEGMSSETGLKVVGMEKVDDHTVKCLDQDGHIWWVTTGWNHAGSLMGSRCEFR